MRNGFDRCTTQQAHCVSSEPGRNSFQSWSATRVLGVLGLPICFNSNSFAQPGGITGPINPAQWIPLPGHVNPNVRPEFDQGLAPASLEIQSVTLQFKPSDSQQADLDQLLLDQQNPKLSSYHRWLTPEQYADRFGVSSSDLAKIADWARTEGLTVTGTARARNAMSLSGRRRKSESRSTPRSICIK